MSNKYPGGIITSGANAGYSVAFDGSGDFLSLATNAAFNFGSGAFTVECWFYPNTISGTQCLVTNYGSSTTGFVIQMGGSVSGSGKIDVNLSGDGADITGVAVLTANTWNHIAVSGTPGASGIRLFVNGVQTGSTYTGSTTLDTSSSLLIGSVASTNYVNGYISNVRIVKGTALYTAAFTPPTQLFNVPGTSLLTCNSPAIVDQSSNNFTITANGNAAASTFTPFTGYTAYNPALGASTPGVWTVSEALEARQTRRWNMYDPYFNYTTLLLHGNGTNGAQNNTFLDSSSNNFTITRNGNTTQGTFSPFSQTGWSNFFDGSGDFLTTPSNTAFEFGTGDFTIEFWAYVQNSGETALVGTRTGDTVSTIRWSIFTLSGALSFQAYNSADAAIGTLSFQTSLPKNTFVHCAVVRSGTTFRLYQNGVQSTSSLTSSDILANNSTVIRVGDFDTSSIPDLNGYISNLRITKGGALYTSSFTPSTTPLTTTISAGTVSLLTCQSNRFIDNSSNAFAITTSGTPSVQAFSPFYPVVAYTPQAQGGSGYFDGTGDFLTVADNVALRLGTSAYTVEFWWYPNSSAATQCFLNKSSSGDGSPIAYYAWSDGKFHWANGSTDLVGYSYTVSLYQWYHVAFVRTSTSTNDTRLYINGTLAATYTDSVDYTNTGTLNIACQISGASAVNGYFTNFRMVKGSAIAPPAGGPTSPLTAVTNTSLLLNFTNAGVIDSTGDNVLETVGNASISTTQSKFGGSSLYFDGTGDYLVARYNPNLEFGSGDFTVECWVYFSTLPSNNFACITSYGDSDGSPRWIFYYDSRTSQGAPGLRFTVIDGTNTAIVDVVGGGTSGWAANTWYHVAITRSGSSWRLFRDGTQTGSTVTDTDAVPTASNNGLYVGSEPTVAGLLTGYIDDLRITKGYARYTANFTPQTSQWQDQ